MARSYNGSIGVSKTFGGSSILSRAANQRVNVFSVGIKRLYAVEPLINTSYKVYGESRVKQCPKCLKDHDKPGKFCSRSCANSRKFSADTIKRKSDSAYRFLATPEGDVAVSKRSETKRGQSRSREAIQSMVDTRLANTQMRFERGEVTETKVIRRLLTERYGYSCSVCSLSMWNDQTITLQVDHIDGNPGNNLPNNLRLLCPNCHSQTETWGGRNKGFGRKARGLK